MNQYAPPHPEGFQIKATLFGVKHQANTIKISGAFEGHKLTVYGAAILNNSLMKQLTRPKYYVNSVVNGVRYLASEVQGLSVIQKYGPVYLSRIYTIRQGSVELV